MFRTLSLCSLLVFSLTCFAQVTTTGGYATTSSPAIGMAPFSVANAPIASTPDIALPGSGPAVGAPLGNTNSNDSRISTGASVANRNSIYSEPAMSNVTAETGIPDNGVTAASNGASAASTTTAQAGTAEAYNMGIQHFESGLAGKSANSLSLAELARRVRGSRHPATRVINNDSIAQLNARGATTGNIPIGNPANGNATSTEAANPASQTNAAAEPTGTLMARNQPPPFSQQQAPQHPAEAENATAGQQRHPAAESAGSTAAPQSTTAAAENQNSGANPSAAASTNKSLPQTGSHLPLLLLLGVLGVGAGSVYLLRR